MSPELTMFLNTYKALNSRNLALLDDIYHPDVEFVDPAHAIKGLPELRRYFTELYADVTSISFTFGSHMQEAQEAYVQWLMDFCHPRLQSGETISLPGVSNLHFDLTGKVLLHRDFFDLGALLYEHVPLLGGIITHLKKRLGT